MEKNNIKNLSKVQGHSQYYDDDDNNDDDDDNDGDDDNNGGGRCLKHNSVVRLGWNVVIKKIDFSFNLFPVYIFC